MDREVINPRERPVSTDLMDMQAMLARVISDSLGYASQSEFQPSLSADPTIANENYVLGLRVRTKSTDTANVYVDPGALVQYSSTLAPTPGTWDSSFRVAFNRSALQVPITVSGSDCYYLLEAQAVDTLVASEMRDVLNEVTGKFDATLVSKKYELRITTQWKAGSATTAPTPTGGDWVPLAVVFVPAAGALYGITAADLIDVRPQLGYRVRHRFNRGRRPTVGQFESVATPSAGPSQHVHINVDEAVSNQDSSTSGQGGVRMFLRMLTTSPWQYLESDILESGTSISDGQFYYVYLCPWNGLAPEYVGNYAYGRGIPLLSAKAPDAHGYNAQTLTLTAPLAATVPVGCAPCVGAFRRNGDTHLVGLPGANTGWTPMKGAGSVYRLFREQTLGPSQVASDLSGNANTKTLNIPATGLPLHARTARLQILFNQTSAAGESNVRIDVCTAGSSSAIWEQVYVPASASFAGQVYTAEIDVPVLSSGIDIILTRGGAQQIGDTYINIIGFSV